MSDYFPGSVINIMSVLGILGAFLCFLGLALLIPIIPALIYSEAAWQAFLIPATGSSGIGAILYYLYKPSRELRLREAFIVVGLTWVLLSAVGALPFMLSGVLENYTDAFFETMSGFTTTGATIFGGTTSSGNINPDIESLPKSLIFWRSVLHWLGGMGFIVLSIAILPLLGTGGMQLFQAESSLLSSDKLTPRVQQTAKFLWYVYLGFTVLHFLLLWVHPKMDWFEAINHAFSTLATGGFSTKDASIAAFDSVYIDSVIILFMFLAGINFVLHFRMLRGEILNVTENRELRFYTLVTLIAIALITFSLWMNHYDTFGEALRYGAFQALSILTTTGYGTDDYTLWPAFALFLIFLLFFTGGCTGSTSGGIKMTRWIILIRSSFREIKQAIHPKGVYPIRMGSKVIDPAVSRTVFSFFVLYLMIFITGVLILSALNIDFISAIGASIACLGNIGPAIGEFGPVNNYAHMPWTGKWVLSLLMLIGRLEVFTVIVLFSATFWKQ
ncbi:MAG: potassium transporter TrkG [Balneolales bacterium]